VLLAVCQEFGIEVAKDVIPQIAVGFAGGIGNTGSVCGAVVGAVMAIGLIRGRGETMQAMLENLALAQEFRQRFEAEMGNIGCRELTGLDLSTEEGLKQSMATDTAQRVCFPAVATSFQLVTALLKEANQT